MKPLIFTPFVWAIGALLDTATAQTVPDFQLPPVVVTAPRMSLPLAVVMDPQAPHQPVPAHDGADYLKTIPGFSVIRKGGTAGDPVLRGMAGSRLNILLDGQHILGGCGGRMDPPTAYVFPQAYDRITVLKGPQTVRYGAGSSAGTVLFERQVARFAASQIKFNGSLMVSSFGRHDEVADVLFGNPNLYLRAGATHSKADDFKDGDGRTVHSGYARWSTQAALGLTPDARTQAELSLARSDGKAAYADRGMDGAKFARTNLALKFEKHQVSPLIDHLEANIYRNDIDHVMDNYSLRPTPGMRMVSNPDRTTSGARVAATLRPTQADELTVGMQRQEDVHTFRAGTTYQSQPRMETARFRNLGLFGELTHRFAKNDRVVAGLRTDRWQAQDSRAKIAGLPNPTAGAARKETLKSGFARYERDLAGRPVTLFAGIGHTERFPDYWELISKEGADSLSAFHTRAEKTTQIDIGAIYQSDALHVSVSGFYGKVDDFILIQSRTVKGTRSGLTIARNIDASTWGGELGAAYALSARWKVDGALAYVRGDNDTDRTALAQTPPLEARLGLTYDDQTWSFGPLLRLVAKQDRFDPNKGNIAGQDIGRTAGFGIFSIHASYRPKKGVLMAAGIDNVFDKTYAEHLSRSGAMVAGYPQTTRVNEPGRTLWIKTRIALD